MELRFQDPLSGQPIAVLHSGQRTITIGRASSCDVVIPPKYSSVSSCHALINSKHDSFEIMDGDGRRPSTNGLYINGVRQSTGVWLSLKPGMNVSLGRPGLASSITLIVATEARKSLSPDGRSASSLMEQSIGRDEGMPKQSPATYSQGLPNTISEAMRMRLERIDSHLSNGYALHKEPGVFPVFIGNNSRNHSITILDNPAGFSWIAFFFPFAVCTQIREWSYFYMTFVLFTIAAVINVMTKYDPSPAISMGIAVVYGMYYPYFRHMALTRGVKEISRGGFHRLGNPAVGLSCCSQPCH